MLGLKYPMATQHLHLHALTHSHTYEKSKQTSAQSSSPGTSFLLPLLLQTGAWEETNIPAPPLSLPLKT